MRALVAHGADPLLPNEDGTTALMVAAGVGIWAVGESPGTNEEALQAVKLMLELGDVVTTVDANGDTALHGAVIRVRSRWSGSWSTRAPTSRRSTRRVGTPLTWPKVSSTRTRGSAGPR